MDGPSIKPHQAKALRMAMKETENLAITNDSGILCDVAEIRGVDGGKGVALVMLSKGEVISFLPVTNAILKRLKKELGLWAKIKNGSFKENWFGNFIVGKE